MGGGGREWLEESLVNTTGLTARRNAVHRMATGPNSASAHPDIAIVLAIVLPPFMARTLERTMADRGTFALLDVWIDAVFSYGETRRIPVAVVRDGADLIAIANLGPDFDVTLPYDRPIVEAPRGGKPVQRESVAQYAARTAKSFERAVIEARKSKMAAFTGRQPAAARA